jgi:hypothetical protein
MALAAVEDGLGIEGYLGTDRVRGKENFADRGFLTRVATRRPGPGVRAAATSRRRALSR